MPRLLNGFIPDLPPASIRFAIDGFGPFSTLSFLSFTAPLPPMPDHPPRCYTHRG